MWLIKKRPKLRNLIKIVRCVSPEIRKDGAISQIKKPAFVTNFLIAFAF